MMKIATHLLVPALVGLLLLGCDAGKEPYARAAEAEAAGKLTEAATLYGEVCAKAASSPRCPLARTRAERLRVKEGWKAFDEGRFAKAKELFAAAGEAKDGSAKQAASAAVAYADLTQGLAYEEATGMADKKLGRPRMEAVAAASVGVSPKAREWLDKNLPAMLLDDVKAACSPTGQGSCSDLGKELGARYPSSPEAAAAKALCLADYGRIYPRLKEAENLLIQRVGLYDKAKKLEFCLSQKGSQDEDARQACAAEGGTAQAPTVEFLTKAWEKKLEEIHDAGYVHAFEARWKRASDAGEQDPEPWPKPAGQK